jgi:2,3-bisphosphoglycerate-independent phosphoglycerate mutase
MENGKPKTAHTTNPVPLILVSKKRRKLKKGMTIASVAPTILEMLGLPVPKEMADSLLK